MSAILDASAFLALMLGERGGEVVLAVARGSLISAVNFCESMTRAIDRGHDSEDVRRIVRRLEIGIAPFEAELAQRAADLRGATRAPGISLGDRACLALAQATGRPIYTADQRWADLDLDLGIDIRLIRTRHA